MLLAGRADAILCATSVEILFAALRGSGKPLWTVSGTEIDSKKSIILINKSTA